MKWTLGKIKCIQNSMLLFVSFSLYCSSSHQSFFGRTHLINTILKNSVTINGSLICDNLTIKDNLHVNGSLKGKNLIVEKAFVNGSVSLANSSVLLLNNNGRAQLEDFTVVNINSVGSCDLKNSTVTQTVYVVGKFEAMNCTCSIVHLCCTLATLDNTKVEKDVIFEESKSTTQGWFWRLPIISYFFSSPTIHIQELYLKNGTVIKGDIVFKSRKGKIYCSYDSKIIGKVIGAEVIKK